MMRNFAGCFINGLAGCGKARLGWENPFTHNEIYDLNQHNCSRNIQDNMLLYEYRGSRNRPGCDDNRPFGQGRPFAFRQSFEHQITGKDMNARKTVIRAIRLVNEIDQPVGQPRLCNHRTTYGRLVEKEGDIAGDESQA